MPLEILKEFLLRVDTLIKNERFRISKILNNVASVTTNLKESNEEIANILKNVSEISDTLSKVDMVGTIENAKSSLEEVNAILYDVQHGDGTLTHLIQDSTLYHQVDDMIFEATRLIENIKTYPKNMFISVSLVRRISVFLMHVTRKR